MSAVRTVSSRPGGSCGSGPSDATRELVDREVRRIIDEC
jgi:hypothetical protein